MYPFPFLSRTVSAEVFADLLKQLPPPQAETPEARNARDMAAMTAIAALAPIDYTEAMLAVRVVATDAHARDNLSQAVANRANLPVMLRCQAQAASMMRQSQQAHRALLHLQATRPLSARDSQAEPAVEAADDRNAEVMIEPTAEPMPAPTAPAAVAGKHARTWPRPGAKTDIRNDIMIANRCIETMMRQIA